MHNFFYWFELFVLIYKYSKELSISYVWPSITEPVLYIYYTRIHEKHYYLTTFPLQHFMVQ